MTNKNNSNRIDRALVYRILDIRTTRLRLNPSVFDTEAVLFSPYLATRCPLVRCDRTVPSRLFGLAVVMVNFRNGLLGTYCNAASLCLQRRERAEVLASCPPTYKTDLHARLCYCNRKQAPHTLQFITPAILSIPPDHHHTTINPRTISNAICHPHHS